MAKHRLLLSPTRIHPERVVLHCANCPKYIELDHTSIYAILVERSRMLIDQISNGPESVRKWSNCRPYNY